MILWTPMQLELVLEGIETMASPQMEHICRLGVPMLVEKTKDGKRRIDRVLSTDPMDYLDLENTPGRYLDC